MNIGLILARSGSKGIPNKNLQKVGELTLIEWAYWASIDASCIDATILSTDYSSHQLPNINCIHRRRPSHLCTDLSTSYDAIVDAIEWYKKSFGQIDSVTLLEPPCPFRNGALIDSAYKLYLERNASSIVTLKCIDDVHPVRIKKLSNDGQVSSFHSDYEEPLQGMPRQLQEQFYVRDTAVYIFDAKNFEDKALGLYGRKPFGLLNSNITVNIDTELDLISARAIYDASVQGLLNVQMPKNISNARGAG